jgi:hypothetical protein
MSNREYQDVLSMELKRYQVRELFDARLANWNLRAHCAGPDWIGVWVFGDARSASLTRSTN